MKCIHAHILICMKKTIIILLIQVTPPTNLRDVINFCFGMIIGWGESSLHSQQLVYVVGNIGHWKDKVGLECNTSCLLFTFRVI